MGGPVIAGPDACHAGAGRPFHVGDSEDDHDAFGRPTAGADQQDDAVDDAVDVRLLHDHISQRVGGILDCLKRGRHRNTGIRHGLEADYGPAKIPRLWL